MNVSTDKTRDDPARAYLQYAAAIEHRDVESVLGRLSVDYGRHLRAAHRKGFPALFELWCETFPRLLAVVACFVDGDCATVEMLLKSDGKVETGHAVLLLQGARWCVDFECRANGSTRIPAGRFHFGSLRPATASALVSQVSRASAESRAVPARRSA